MSTVTILDSRKRLNLAPFATSNVYLLTAEEDGRILLEPADVVSRIEKAALSNPEIVAALAEADSHPERAVEG
jgi:hypothetical protein